MKRLSLITLTLFTVNAAILLAARGKPGIFYFLAYWANGNFYLAAPDGSYIRPLTVADSGSVNEGLSWSKQGGWIAFYHDGGIYKVRLSGIGRQHLVERRHSGLNGFSLQWSPDGRTFFFYDPATSRIYRMASDGTQLQQVTEKRGYEGYPAMSPDGEWLAFSGKFMSDEGAHIYLMHPDGSDLHSVHNAGNLPRWMPDSKGLIFQAYSDDGASDTVLRLFYLDLSTGVERPITPIEYPSDSTYWSISPDGRQLVYQAEDSLPYIVQIADGSFRQLADIEAGRFAWSPDGEWIVMLDIYNSNLYRVRQDGRDLQRLPIPEGYVSAPSFSPSLD